MCEAPYPMGFSIVLQIAHISLILLILPLLKDLFHILTFQKLEVTVCSYLVVSVH